MKFDKVGSNFDLVIGGINVYVKNEHTRPEIQLYRTDLTFTEGGNSNRSPLLIACLKMKAELILPSRLLIMLL